MSDHKYLYRHLIWPEARERAQQGAVIVFPVAAIEQRGYHLPILPIDVELVDMSKATDRETPSIANKFIYDDLFGMGPVHTVTRWSRISDSGGEGDPLLAAPEKGKAFSEAPIENLIEFCTLSRAMEMPPGRDFNYKA